MITQSTTIKSQIPLPKTVLAQFGFSNHCSQAVFDTWELKKALTAAGIDENQYQLTVNYHRQWGYF